MALVLLAAAFLSFGQPRANELDGDEYARALGGLLGPKDLDPEAGTSICGHVVMCDFFRCQATVMDVGADPCGG